MKDKSIEIHEDHRSSTDNNFKIKIAYNLQSFNNAVTVKSALFIFAPKLLNLIASN